MTNDICMFNLCARRTSFRRYIGSLVFTPQAIYFLNTGRIPYSNGMLGLSQIANYVLVQKSHRSILDEGKRDTDQFKDEDNHIQQLDRLVQDDKGSIKIEKSTIKDIKLPSNALKAEMKITTDDRTHSFNIQYAIRNNRLPELTNYLNNHFYIQN